VQYRIGPSLSWSSGRIEELKSGGLGKGKQAEEGCDDIGAREIHFTTVNRVRGHDYVQGCDFSGDRIGVLVTARDPVLCGFEL
jgi:hypothetical protein